MLECTSHMDTNELVSKNSAKTNEKIKQEPGDSEECEADIREYYSSNQFLDVEVTKSSSDIVGCANEHSSLIVKNEVGFAESHSVHIVEHSVKGDFEEVNDELADCEGDDSAKKLPKRRTREFRCIHCEFKTNYKHCLKKHITGKHENIKRFLCNFCSFKTKRQSNLVEHFRANHDENSVIYQCEFCECKYKHRPSLRKHISIVHNETTEWLTCSYCDYKTKRSSNLKIHRRRKHEGGLVTKTEEDNNHYEMHGKEGFITSEEHGKDVTKYQTNIVKTKRKSNDRANHDENSGMHQCEFCKRKYKHRYNLHKHINIVHNESTKWLTCSYCNYKTKLKWNLKVHCRMKHKEGLVIKTEESNPKQKIAECDFKETKKEVSDEGNDNQDEMHSEKGFITFEENGKDLTDCLTNINENKMEETLMNVVTTEESNPKQKIAESDSRETKKEVNDEANDNPDEMHSEKDFIASEENGKDLTVCETNINENEMLETSMNVVTTEKLQFDRKFCGYKAKSGYCLKSHTNCKHSRNVKWFRCNLCEYKAERKGRLLCHLNIHKENPEMYQCYLCKRKYINKRSLIEHITHKHSENAVTYQCNYCDYKTKYKGSLSTHSIIHSTDLDVYHCSFCEYKGKSERNLKKHFNSIHNENIQWHQCDSCEYKAKVNRDLVRHINWMHSENPKIHICQFCGHKTKDKGNLTTHIKRLHSNEAKWYQCNYCDFITKYKQALMIHFKAKHNKNSK